MYRIIIFLIFSCLFQVPEAQAREKNDIDSLKNMLQLATKADSIEIFLLLGEEYYSMEDYSTALDIFFSCLKLSESINLTSRSADASNNIGRIYYDMENYGEALRYFNKALNYFIITKDEPRQGGVFNNIALIYYELDSIDLAVEFYTKALEIKQKYGGKLDMATIYHNLGLVYMHTNQVDLAVKNLESSRKIFIDLGFEKYAVNTTNNIGRALYRDGRYKEALNYYEEGLKEAKNINSAFLIMDNYKYQADCYAKLDNYEAAYRFTNEYYNLKDSLLNLDKEKELAEIHARYENEISEQENEILKNENEAKAATIKMQFMLVIGILIIFMLVGVLAIIYYRANQSKKKANKLLYSQKVEIQEKNDVLSRLNEEITNQNNAIKKQKKELEELNGIKDKLFSIISHEFRSPLNSLKGTLALLKLGALSDEELNVISKELTDKINSTSIFLDNLLNWAKSQMQGINPKPASLDLYELAEENIKLLKSMGDKKKVRIINEIPENSMAFIDPNMLNLILRNLISNAIKFSMRGGIIRVQTITENGMNTISVSDSGIGMTEENIKMLFQVQTFTTRGTANERGTGLGLYISKNFIESNGGEIWVESEEGKGSVFNFTVPTGA
jgi:two-component system, sensor histidine kinase and response regulator